MKSFVDMIPKPSATPKQTSRVVSPSAFMHRQRNARRQSSRMLTERISAMATSGIRSTPRCVKDTDDKLTIREASVVQRNTTVPSRISPT